MLSYPLWAMKGSKEWNGGFGGICEEFLPFMKFRRLLFIIILICSLSSVVALCSVIITARIEKVTDNVLQLMQPNSIINILTDDLFVYK